MNDGFLLVVMLSVYADIFHNGSVRKALPDYIYRVAMARD